MSEMLGPLDVQSVSYVDLFNEFWKALLTNLPTFLLAWAVFDLAGFFGRCGEGNIFTPRNVRTLKIASECLAWAAIVDVIIAPTVISWIERDARGIIWNSNDLAYGIFAVGFALYGFAFILSQAVKIKEENDEIV